MIIYLGSDHAGYHLKEKVEAYLLKQGYKVEDVGARTLDPADDYPDIARAVREPDGRLVGRRRIHPHRHEHDQLSCRIDQPVGDRVEDPLADAQLRRAPGDRLVALIAWDGRTKRTPNSWLRTTFTSTRWRRSECFN